MSKKILGVNIDDIIRRALRESFPEDERKNQAKKAKEMEDFRAPKKSGKDETDDVDEDAGDEVTQKVKAATIVDLLNTMRSGKTLKDKEVRTNFQAYFDSLTGSERVALFSFCKAIADIIAGENSLEDIKNQPNPDDYGVEIVKDKKSSQSTETKPSKPKDTSAPIVVGEAADKSNEIRIMWRLK